MTVSIQRLSPAEFAMLAPTLVDIYMEAMGYAPSIRTGRIRVWKGEVRSPGFTALAAVDDGVIVGVAYGFIGTRERWWDRQLVRAMHELGGPTQRDREMLADYFEVAEIHVSPSYQGRGIGKRLLTELLRAAPTRWALLSTPEVTGEANNAFRLYRAFGFTDVARNFLYDGDSRPFAILALDLAGAQYGPAGAQ